MTKPPFSEAVRHGAAPTEQSTSAMVPGPAHDVVVVVPDPRLVARHRAGRLDPADQPGRGEGPQHVVDGLVGHRRELGAHRADDRVGIGVRVRVHRSEHREPRSGHRRRAPQHPLELRAGPHAAHYPPLLERIKTPPASRIRTRRVRRSTTGPRLISPTYQTGNIELCDSVPAAHLEHHVPPSPSSLLAAAVGAALVLVTTAACSGGSSDVVGAPARSTQAPAADGLGGTINLYAYAVPKPGFDKLIPAFTATAAGKGRHVPAVLRRVRRPVA